LRKILSYSTPQPEREQIVVVNAENTKYGLVVDRLLGIIRLSKKSWQSFPAALNIFQAHVLWETGGCVIINVNSFMK
jgi:chemotaxis signal transduction protein